MKGARKPDLDRETTCEILQLRKLLKGSACLRAFSQFSKFLTGEGDFLRNISLKFCTYANRELENLRLYDERLKLIMQ